MATFIDRLNEEKVAVATTVSTPIAEAIDYANASLALDGLELDDQQLARQREVIEGKLSVEEAIALARAESGAL